MKTIQRKFFQLVFVLAIGLSASSYPLVSNAENNNGGIVQTKGAIQFYEESSSSSNSDNSSSESTLPNTANRASNMKPAGEFPSTGEMIQTGVTFLGIMLLALLILLFIIKRSKQKQEEEAD